MEGGDILYIIVLAIFLLSGLLKKKGKKNEEKRTIQSVPTPSGESVSEYDDWFTNNEEVEIVEEKIPFPEKNIQTYENSGDFNHLRAHQKVTNQMKHSVSSNLKTVNETATPSIELNNVDEARKAFIYSEIFQRKY